MANMYTPPRQKHEVNNFKFALGMGMNWVDLDKNCMYMIQEYSEKLNDPTIPESQKPKKIRIMNLDGTVELGAVEPEIIEERMKDPDADPKYAPETPAEHRRNM